MLFIYFWDVNLKVSQNIFKSSSVGSSTIFIHHPTSVYRDEIDSRNEMSVLNQRSKELLHEQRKNESLVEKAKKVRWVTGSAKINGKRESILRIDAAIQPMSYK